MTLTIQELIDCLSELEDKDRKVFLFDNSKCKVHKIDFVQDYFGIVHIHTNYNTDRVTINKK
jgi:hypothetical protein